MSTIKSVAIPSVPLEVADSSLFGVSVIAFVTGTTQDPVNGATDDWDIDNASNPMQSDAWRCGYGWEKYRDAVVARDPVAAAKTYKSGTVKAIDYGTSGGTPTIQFAGTSLIHFLSLFDRVILGHGCPPKVIQRIKAASQVGTKVGLWSWSNWLETYPLYSGWEEQLRVAVRNAGGFVFGTAPTCAGYATVDPFEPSTWKDAGHPAGGGACQYPTVGGEGARNYSSGHLWYVNMNDATIRSTLVTAYRTAWDSYWKQSFPSLDFFHSDNYPTKKDGTQTSWVNATNGPIRTTTTETTAWDSFVTALKAAFPGGGSEVDLKDFSANIGGHGGGNFSQGAISPTLKRQFWEHSFLKGDASGYYTQAQILAGVQTSLTNDIAEIYVGARHPDSDRSSNTYPIPQFETDPDHADLRAILSLVGTKVGRYFLMFQGNGGLSDAAGILYHGPTVRRIY